MVPHLITALTGPINELEQRILDSMPAIERWFRLEWMEHTPPFYTSVDIRNAGFKLAPVDTNLFPGGWNNLTKEMLPLAVQAAMAAIEKICPEARNLLIIPENHTRNSFYLATVVQLQDGLGALTLDKLCQRLEALKVLLTDGLGLACEGLALWRYERRGSDKHAKVLGASVQKCPLRVSEMPLGIRCKVGHGSHHKSVVDSDTIVQCIGLKDGLNVHCLLLFVYVITAHLQK